MNCSPSTILTLAAALAWLACLSVRVATFNIANGDIAAFRSAINTANTNAQADMIILATGGSYVGALAR